MQGGERKRNRKGGKGVMAAPAGSAEELDEDAGREEGLPTPGGEWDEGKQGPGGRDELEKESGVGEERRTPARAEVQGSQPRDSNREHWRETEWITPSGMNGARKSIQRSVIGRRETSMIELWKATRS